MSGRSVVIVLLLALAACGPAKTPEHKSAPSKMARFLAPLPTDPQKAAIELQKRLDASIEIKDGFLIVHDPIIGELDETILPTNTSWSVSCGLGFSVAFGSAISGDETSVSNATELNLALGVVPRGTCDVAGLAVAKHLRAILTGTNEPPPAVSPPTKSPKRLPGETPDQYLKRIECQR